ncbi:MAG: hypothetical protein E5Y79_10065 [Mesorhizobium sp.]|nr:MAG: hypothetical protein E5Y79_10065 [Mesorhizobium sp.]
MPRTSETPAKSAGAIEASGGGPIADGPLARTFAAMVAQHVELVVFEQSLGKGEGLPRPSVIVWADAAEKTAAPFLASPLSAACLRAEAAER